MKINDMKNIYIILIALFFTGLNNAMAYHDRAWNTVNNNRSVNASGCSRATTSTTMEYNNVRALIHTGGDMWWDLVGQPKYEIPKGSGKTALFAGAIWIGGTDINDQLRLAAIKFRSSGVDYWTGPLIVSGMDRATVTPDVCSEYDRHFVISRQEVSDFRTYINAFLAGDTETLERDFENYKIPDVILDWPGNGDLARGYDGYLAPYVDNDASGDYNPMGGDYPFFDLDGSEPCGTSREDRKPRLYGDQTMWWVYNDKGNVHTETNGEAIGMEIRAQYYAFATADELNNMTFGNYALINRSTYTLYNAYFGVWTDADLGYAFDDYVGCDVTRGLGYLYNGNEVDGTGNGNEYGEHPPAIGVDFFEGPYMDPWVKGGDTLDRPSAYVLDANGNSTGIIDTSMAKTTDPDGLYNGGINGLNFGDSIGGNERWGMRRFLYFNNDATNQGDPTFAQQYYNYLDGKWKDNRPLTFGGTGYAPGGGTPAHFMFPGITDPVNWGTEGEDPGYTIPGGWTEKNESNAPNDKRFVQSAGPFTLTPGAVNDITVGMVWARATSGNAFESVKKVQEADDKAQQLFDNCFVMIDGPDSPDLKITELDGELIFQIHNEKGRSNNYVNTPEDYCQRDPFIILPQSIHDAIDNDGSLTDAQKAAKKDSLKKYRFEGYQIFQVKDKSVTTADLNNPEYARLIFQCDIANHVDKLINYVNEPITGKLQPQLMVDGNDDGVSHTFKLTENAFATSDKALVNHQKYYFIAIAYAYNEYKLYDPEDGTALDGQKLPYLRGRKSSSGSIKTFMGMPHKNIIQNGGTVINSKYGDGLPVTQLEGMGNGNNILNLKQTTIDKIMSGAPWKTTALEYEAGEGPISVKIVDPLNVKDDDYILRFDSVQYSNMNNLKESGYIENAKWYMYSEKYDSTLLDTTIMIMLNDSIAQESDVTLVIPMVKGIDSVLYSYKGLISTGSNTFKVEEPQVGTLKLYPEGTIFSEKTINIENEQIISDLGISISIKQVNVPGPGPNPGSYDNLNYQNGFLTSELIYDDPTKFWLTGVRDNDGENLYNWIRSGVSKTPIWGAMLVNGGNTPVDGNNNWSDIINGIFSVYRLVMYDQTDGLLRYQAAFEDNFVTAQGDAFDQYKRTPSIDLIITKDTTLWSRCPVVEMCEYDTTIINGTVHYKHGPSEGSVEKFDLRSRRSVYRNGKPIPKSDAPKFTVNGEEFIAEYGMGWFPGYAIDVETGERLNVFFGEDSRWGAYNGRDMMWNPHSKEYTDLYALTGGMAGDLLFGGKHNIYIWGHSYYADPEVDFINDKIKFISNAYDGGARLYALLTKSTDESIPSYNRNAIKQGVYDNVVYAARPMLNMNFDTYDPSVDPYGFIQSDITIKIRMANPYRGLGNYDDEGKLINKSTFLKTDEEALNNNAPMYSFSTEGFGVGTSDQATAESALDLINIVPNPYYAYDNYELKQTQKLVKFTNLPETCTISIYNIGGNLVRKFDKSSPLTYLDWDLKNEYGIEIAGGVYIVHINVPGVGEKVLKWFGALRPIDLNNI